MIGGFTAQATESQSNYISAALLLRDFMRESDAR